MDKLFIPFCVALLLTITVQMFTSANNDALAQRLQYTKAICDKSHMELNGSSEQRCGDMLDKTGTIYTCNNNGTQCHLVKE